MFTDNQYVKNKHQIKFREIVTEFMRELIRVPLMKCSPGEIEKFNRMYISIDKIDADKMETAYCQVMRTVEKNHG